MQGIRANWEMIKPLGSGGQSDVSLVRHPDRVAQRTQLINRIISHSPWASEPRAEHGRSQRTRDFADAVVDYARADTTDELGAMKQFKIRDDEQQAITRLKQEIEVLSDSKRTGLPKLLDFNVAERWMVTEFFPYGTLEDQYSKYQGNVYLALKAFLSLLRTVKTLHEKNIVHRDIKPANVFVRSDSELVLGDFGIVFIPGNPRRLTRTNESVGPHDYMPPWADLGGRLENVHPSFDLYMLGKLLWCMVSGKPYLPREWFNQSDHPDYDLTVIFREDPYMHYVNTILGKCLVEQSAQCVTSASELCHIVGVYITAIERGGQVLKEGVERPCRVCGNGFYKLAVLSEKKELTLRLWDGGGANDIASLGVKLFMCDRCGHVEWFRR